MAAKLTESEREIVQLILQKTDRLRKKLKMNIRLLSLRELEAQLSSPEKKFVKQLLQMDPLSFGFRGVKLGVKPVPSDMVRVTGQKYFDGKRWVSIDSQFVPKKVKAALDELNRQVAKDLGSKFLIDSGYRSPGYQLVVLLEYLRSYDFDLGKTLKKVALPGYSEHGDPKHTALDLMTKSGIFSDSEDIKFESTLEYKWLQENAGKFGFVESYPRGNKLGIMFEPWHWRYMGK